MGTTVHLSIESRKPKDMQIIYNPFYQRLKNRCLQQHGSVNLAPQCTAHHRCHHRSPVTFVSLISGLPPFLLWCTMLPFSIHLNTIHTVIDTDCSLRWQQHTNSLRSLTSKLLLFLNEVIPENDILQRKHFTHFMALT